MQPEVHRLHPWAVDVLKISDKSSIWEKTPLAFQNWQRQSMLKKIRLTSGWRASLKTPSLKLPDSVRPHVNARKWIFLYSVNSRICGQFEPFRDFFLEPWSSNRPNVSFWNWNSVTQRIFGQVHPHEILVAHFLATTEIPSSLTLCYYSVPQLHEHLNENIYTWGAFFWENPNAGFRIQKRILRFFFGQIQKRIMNP